MGVEQIHRGSLVERLLRSTPTVIALIAPAGFGKSFLARQYLEARPGRLCDCEGVRDDLDLARRLLPEISAELDDGSLSLAERVERALAAWASVEGTVVFENVDRSASGARTFLTGLMSRRSNGATIVLVGRDAAQIQVTKYVSPQNAVILRAVDLAFTRDEMRAFLDVDDGALARCESAARGWPIVLSVLKRVLAEQRAGDDLVRLERVVFDELRDYLAEEVLTPAPPRLMQALFACSAIPRAGGSELRALFGDPQLVADLNEFAKDSPFITRDQSGVFHVHPLFAMLILEHQEERRATMLREIARQREEDGDYVRSAELHAAGGDQHAAARQLARHEVIGDRQPSAQYREVLAKLDRAIVSRHPRLWAVTALARLFRTDAEQLADEAESILRTLPPDAATMQRFYVIVVRVFAASYAGAALDAQEILDDFIQSTPIGDPPRTLLDGCLTSVRAHLRARSGGLTAAELPLKAALAIVADIDVIAAMLFLCLGADIARPRGERALEVQFLHRAHDCARNSTFDNLYVGVLAEWLCGAWFSGDNAAFNAALEALERRSLEFEVPGFTYLIGCARGKRVEPSTRAVLSSVVYGHLMALAHARDPGERLRLAEAALSAAMRTGQPFLETIAAVALGVSDELRFADCMAVARDAMSRCDSPELHRAVAAVGERRSELGMLGPLVSRITRSRTDTLPPIAIDVLAGRVRVDGEPAALSGRELELIVALALRREPVSRARLAALLWPDLGEAASRNALSVCLHRARGHLRRPDLIVRDGNGYRLHDDAAVDLWDVDRAASVLRSREPLRESERVALERALSRLRDESPERTDGWEWFDATRDRLRSLRIDVAHRLAIEALHRNDPSAALQFAQDALSLDDCDEPAHEAVVRAHLLAGDRPAALRAFRRYREALQRELGAEPSEAIAALVEE